MTFIRLVTYTLLSGLGSVLALQAANATCGANPTGAWTFFAVEVDPGANSSGHAISCDMTFSSGGAFTAPCKSYTTGSGSVHSVTVHGTITMGASCAFTGSIVIPGDAAVTVRDGHINGNVGSGIATQKTTTQTQTLLFNLIRK